MSTVVAIAKAASMINNVSVSISFRTATAFNRFAFDEMPYIVIAYDSRRDKFSKISHLFPLLFPCGCTPEGLAFQAILHHIPATTHELDSYFVNLSDGEPYLNAGYHGETATLHTKKQVNKIRETGVWVLSYFIEDDNDTDRVTTNSEHFRTMYGKDAQFIDVENVGQIAYTMNRRFLAKEN